MSYSKEDNNNRGWDIGTEDYDPPRIDMAGLSEKTVYVLYINAIIENSAVLNHDIWRFVSSLQGVINRRLDEHGRCVYVVFKDSVVSNDAFWLEYLSGTGKLLDGYSKVPVYTLENLSDIFKNQLVQTGMILWDTRVPATANVAATTCGLYNYIPVKYDTAENSLYNMFVSRGISVKKNLVGLFTGEGMIPDIGMPSTGSAKKRRLLLGRVYVYVKNRSAISGVLCRRRGMYPRNTAAHAGCRNRRTYLFAAQPRLLYRETDFLL